MKESGEEWEKDVQALEYTIEELERTAQEVPVQEVPVQEQPKPIHTLKIYQNKLILDNFKLKGVRSYKLSHDAEETLSEINITLTVNNSKIDF